MGGNEHKILLALDGLSGVQYEQLCDRVPNLRQTFGSNKQLLHSEGPCNPQAIWAEILTALPWTANGCAGYARAVGNLGRCEVAAESGLLAPITIASGTANGAYMNLPLVEPRSARTWLSDGSLPLQVLVSPSYVADQLPFRNYRARPFACAALARSNVREAVESALAVEEQRLHCLVGLLETPSASKIFARLNCFDLLNHLLGVEWIVDPSFALAGRLTQFLILLGEVIEKIEEHSSIRLAMSAYSHIACKASVNLNKALLRWGVAVEEERSVHSQFDYRQSIVAQIRGATALAASSHSARFDLERTKALSVCGGTISVNRRDFYAPAGVEAGSAEELKQDLSGRFAEFFRGHFDAVRLTTNDSPQSGVPDIAVMISAVEFDDSPDGAIIDARNHPRTTHLAEGFVVTTRSTNSADLKASELNRFVRSTFAAERAS